MGRADHYTHGDNNVICDRCGFKYKASDLKREWNGLYTCPFDWEHRHPQDLIRSKHDDQRPSLSRPGGADVFVPPVLPIADAGPDQVVLQNSQGQLDGSDSRNVNGLEFTYLWSQSSGIPVILSSDTVISPTFVAPTGLIQKEVLQFTLVTSNPLNDSLPDTVDITVPVAPSANAGIDQTLVESSVVQLDGSASTDPDGLPLTYLWVQTSGIAVVLDSYTIVNPSFTAPRWLSDTETLTFSLVVNNGFLDSVADTVDIFVTQPLNSWDMAFVSYASKVLNPLNSAQSCHLSPDRLKFYAISQNNSSIKQYNLTTEGDISTAPSVADASFGLTFATSLGFNLDGTIGFSLNTQTDRIEEFTMDSPYDFTVAPTPTGRIYSIPLVTSGFYLAPDGLNFYIAHQSGGDKIKRFAFGTAFDMDTITDPSDEIDVSAPVNSIFGVQLKPNGTKLYALSSSDSKLHQWSLPTPGILTGATKDVAVYSITPGATNGGFWIVENGDTMYISSAAAQRHYQYTIG